MDTIYYISGALIAIGLPTFALVILAGLFKPHLINDRTYIKSPLSRKKIATVGLAGLLITFLGFGSVLAATEPASVKQARAANEATAQLKQQEQAKTNSQKPTPQSATRNETKTENIPFTTVEQPDGGLAKGQQKIIVEGANGERTITYEIHTLDGKETSRNEVSNAITKPPVNKVISVGTYVAPAPAPSSGSGYTNSQGNYVPSPSSNPNGATAKCRDGTYSYSQSRSGTCSHHGGVAAWL